MAIRVSSGDLEISRVEEQDTTMVDIGEKGRPPGEPPDAPGSWVRKVLGSNAGGMPVPEEVIDAEFVESRLKLEFPNGEDGEPVITIGEEVLTAMNGLWKKCMIVKVLGRNVPLPSLTRKLKELWKPSGSMVVMDLPRNFFMVRFESEEEYMNALSGGPWRAFGSCLMVQAWSPEFDPLRDEILTTPVWVRLSHIPVNLYHKAILMGIAKGLGRPIKVDLTTLNFERARFARICVEVNLNKPLKGTVMINGERYGVSYEGISTICSICGMYGHLAYACPRKTVERAPINVITQATDLQKDTGAMEKETGFTSVRPARKNHVKQNGGGNLMWRNEGSDTRGGKVMIGGSKGEEMSEVNVTPAIEVSNRFGGLVDEEQVEEPIEETGRDGANKENENTMNLNQTDPSKRFGTEAFFTAKGRHENLGLNKTGHKEKKAGNVRGPNPLRVKQKNVGPMRGQIFGPTRGETELSMSGKRLRVEREIVGRPGGVFTGDESKTGHGELHDDPQAQPVSKANSAEKKGDTRMELGGESPEGGEA